MATRELSRSTVEEGFGSLQEPIMILLGTNGGNLRPGAERLAGGGMGTDHGQLLAECGLAPELAAPRAIVMFMSYNAPPLGAGLASWPKGRSAGDDAGRAQEISAVEFLRGKRVVCLLSDDSGPGDEAAQA